MTVPAARAGKGKVNLLLADSYVEREAVTDETEPMPYGTEVIVVGIVGGNTLLVASKK